MSAFFRRNSFAIRGNNIALLLVNQVRSNIGFLSGGYSLPSGNALKHYASLVIMVYKGSEMKYGDQTVGIDVRFVIKKNKLAPPFRSFHVPIIFGKGIDYYRDVIEFASLLGVLTKRGSYVYFGETLLGQGIVKASKYLKEHKDTLDKVVETCYNNVNVYKKGGSDE